MSTETKEKFDPLTFWDRTVVVGDVHGCLDEFRELMEQLGIRKWTDARVILLGDLLDKGPDPLGCLRYAREMGFGAVLSNHEERHARFRRREWRREEEGEPNPMRPLSRSALEINRQLTLEDVLWIENSPLFCNLIPGYVAVHGGVNPLKPILDQDSTKFVRCRYVDKETGKPMGMKFLDTDYDKPALWTQPEGSVHWTELWHGPETVVYGHEAFSLSQPLLRDHSIGIDTGVVHGGRLTAFVIEHGCLHTSFAQVKAKLVYCPPPHPIPE